MRFLALAPLFGAICNFGLSVFVLASDSKSRSNQVFFAWGLCIAIWNVGTFALFQIPEDDGQSAERWAHLLLYGVIFIPVTLFHLSLLIAGIRPNRSIWLLYGLHATLALLNATGGFIQGVRFVGYAWYSIAGPGFWVYAAMLSLTVVSVVILTRRRRQLPPMQRNRLNGLIVAQSLIVIFGTNDILPILGIDFYPGTTVPVYPYGSVAAIFYGIIVCYTVMQHQLLDVHVTLGRLAAHLVRFLFLFLIGFALQLTLAVLLGDRISTVAFFCSLAVLMVSTFIASIIFPRLLGSPVEKLERRLLGDRFEYQDQIRNFIESMAWYHDLHTMLNDLHDVLTRKFRLETYQIILRDESTRTFSLFRSHPEAPQRQIPEIKANSPLFHFFEWRNAEYLVVNANYARAGESVLERQARETLSGFQANFCIPLASENDAFGLLLAGAKPHGEPYTATDLNLLIALVKRLSLMVNQIRLKNQILQAQELDLLGRMSRGMAHDLNNLLTPVWTLLQLASETGEPLEEELLPVALRNLKTMRAYIKESLFFSENLRPDLQLGRLDLVIRLAADQARISRKKEMEVTTTVPGEVLVEMDEVLVQRMVANLVANAIDASPARSKVEVHLERLDRAEANREWVRLRIVDYGEGIPKENLNRILTPYFTTKNRGDENRGFGLGLAICRKIVNLHGGNLNISSHLRRGTTVQVDLPSRQVRPPTPAAPLSVA